MLANYIKVALRTIRRQKLYAVINILGLGISIACAILIYLFAHHELSYDSFHHHAASTYRVLLTGMPSYWNHGYQTKNIVPLPLGPTLAEENPQVARVVRMMYAGKTAIKCAGELFRDPLLFVDADFFDFFSFPLIEGDSSSCLQAPNGIVLSACSAEKYFGSRSVLGRQMSIMLEDQFTEFTVTGVTGDLPANSSITFDVLLPLRSYPGYAQRADEWNNYCCATYLRLGKDVSPGELEQGSLGLMDRHYGEKVRRYWEEGDQSVPSDPPGISLQPLEAMHLHPISRADLAASGRSLDPYSLCGIALLILAIACINFTTLATGRAAGRAAEIGERGWI